MKHVSTLTALAVLPGESVPRVSSRQNAEAFDKDHANVLKRIKALIKECPSNFTEVNFDLSNFLDASGRELPHYLLTRDAFSLLVMGFTGAKALTWKVRYIEAFNALERELLGQRLLAAPEGKALIQEGLKLARRLTPERGREIKRAVRYKAMGLSIGETARLLNCGRDKVRNLLRDHELSHGGDK